MWLLTIDRTQTTRAVTEQDAEAAGREVVITRSWPSQVLHDGRRGALRGIAARPIVLKRSVSGSPHRR
jgi:hypothetical protein